VTDSAGLLAVGFAAAAAAVVSGPSRPSTGRRRAALLVPAESSTTTPRSSTPVRQQAAAMLAGVAVALSMGGVGGLLLGAVVGWMISRGLRRLPTRAEIRRRARLAGDLPACAQLVARALEAGAAPVDALHLVARSLGDPVAAVLGPTVARLRLGADPAVVCADLAAAEGFAPLARALRRSLTSGAALAESLDRLAEDLQAERHQALDRRARTVGVRAAAPLGLCFLPAFLLVGVVPVVVGMVAQLMAGLP
jgi:Flp pilus assembly protein TadB